MRKTVSIAISLIVIVMCMSALFACSKYNEYKVDIQVDGDNYSEYVYNDQEGAYFIIFNDQEEELARVSFGTGGPKEVTLSDINEAQFSIYCHAKYDIDSLKVYYNDNLMEPSFVFSVEDVVQLTFDGPIPDKDITIRVEGLTGELKEISYSIPVVDSVPVYLKKGKDFVQIKSTSNLDFSDYDIEFVTTTDGENAVFTFYHGDIIEYYILKENFNLFRYEWEGHSTTGLYDVAEFDGSEEGYGEENRLYLESEGYAMCELEGGVWYRVYQTIKKDIEYSIVVFD